MKHKAIGILGGTFDPIHDGHLRMAIELYQSFDLAKVHLITTFKPMYRNPPFASAEDRLNMVKEAIKPEPALVADEREIRRGGATYTIDTLIEMRAEMPDTPLCLLIGSDAFPFFSTWHRYQEILDYAHIIISFRPGFDLPTEGVVAELLRTQQQQNRNYIHEHLAGGILACPITALDISATEIRKQIAIGGNPRYLLPDDVYEYIKRHEIYKK